jgi:hypothetical protein
MGGLNGPQPWKSAKLGLSRGVSCVLLRAGKDAARVDPHVVDLRLVGAAALGGWQMAMAGSAALALAALIASAITVPAKGGSEAAAGSFRLLPGTLGPRSCLRLPCGP